MKKLAIIKIVRTISEHKQTKSRGQIEVVCLMSDRSLQTRHIYPGQVPKYTPLELILTLQEDAK